jgi:hypothetical protein
LKGAWRRTLRHVVGCYDLGGGELVRGYCRRFVLNHRPRIGRPVGIEVQAIVWVVVVVLLLLLRSSFMEVRTVLLLFGHLPSRVVRFGSRLVEQ